MPKNYSIAIIIQRVRRWQKKKQGRWEVSESCWLCELWSLAGYHSTIRGGNKKPKQGHPGSYTKKKKQSQLNHCTENRVGNVTIMWVFVLQKIFCRDLWVKFEFSKDITKKDKKFCYNCEQWNAPKIIYQWSFINNHYQ